MIPDRFEPLIGWRWWRLGQDALISLNDGVPWTPGDEAIARCRVSWWHDGPLPRCSCGLYACQSRPRGFPPPGQVYGTVSLWGRVIEHERGYRSARAYPRELWLVDDFRCGVPAQRALEVLRRYGVPVHLVGQAETDRALAAELAGVPMPDLEVAALASAARARADAGDLAGAIELVLAVLRTRDLAGLRAADGDGIKRLSGHAFLHDTETRRYCAALEGAVGGQVVTIASVAGQAPAYHGFRSVHLDTRTGQIGERFRSCARPLDEMHSEECGVSRSDGHVVRPSADLALETWLQVLAWSFEHGTVQRAALSPGSTRTPAAARPSFKCADCGLALRAWARHRGSYRCYVRSGQIWHDGWAPFAELGAGTALVAAWPSEHRRRWSRVRRSGGSQDVVDGYKRWFLRSPRADLPIERLVAAIQARRRGGITWKSALQSVLDTPRDSPALPTRARTVSVRPSR